ncbi:MAG: hypothetical protein ACREJO_13405 [Phycisphaerales bacterium]
MNALQRKMIDDPEGTAKRVERGWLRLLRRLQQDGRTGGRRPERRQGGCAGRGFQR